MALSQRSERNPSDEGNLELAMIGAGSAPPPSAGARVPKFDMGSVRPRRHPGRVAMIIVVLVLGAMLVNNVITNERFRWEVFFEYVFSERVLNGVLVTIYLTAGSMAVGVGLGIIAAIMRLSSNPLLSRVALLYTWFFRGVPTLVQLLFWFNLAALLPIVSLGIPFGPEVVAGSPNSFMTPLVAALLGLGIAEGAYMSEIVRAGLLSVDAGQREAAAALGLSERQQLTKILLPQAMRAIIPPTGNDVIAMIKFTSLASMISAVELLATVQQIYQLNFVIVPLLMVATFWYLVLVSVLSVGQYYLERYFGRGVAKRTRGHR